MRACHAATAVLVACACLPSSAGARQSVELRAAFTPARLGEPAAVSLAVQIDSPASSVVPTALTEVTMLYPAGFDFELSGLGIESCSAERLEEWGPSGCSPDSVIGGGTALAEIALGPRVLHESMKVTIVRASEQDGQMAMLFYADGLRPVDAQLVFAGRFLPASGRYGGRLQIKIPTVEALPGAPDMAVVALRAMLGGPGLIYYERVGSSEIPYRPRDVPLPDTCPHDGFPFAATFIFIDGSHARARTTVPCPGA